MNIFTDFGSLNQVDVAQTESAPDVGERSKLTQTSIGSTSTTKETKVMTTPAIVPQAQPGTYAAIYGRHNQEGIDPKAGCWCKYCWAHREANGLDQPDDPRATPKDTNEQP